MNREEKNARHEKDFNAWVKSKNVEVLGSSSETDLKMGDIVTFTNDYGVVFNGMKVLGFCEPDYGRCVYISMDCYWFAVKPESLKVE